MSTIPKEIQDKIDDYINENIGIVFSDADQDLKDANKIARSETKEAIEFGYQVATDGREELENDCYKFEMQALNNRREAEGLKVEITALQSSLKEKEKECEIKINATIQAAKDYLKSREREIEELKAEMTTLRKEVDKNYGLIWKAFYLSVCDLPIEEQEKHWIEFLNANNL